MKITKAQLKQIIMEELGAMTEDAGPSLNIAVGKEIQGLLDRIISAYDVTAEQVIEEIVDHVLTLAQKKAIGE